MSNKYDLVFFIGRFEPFHNGHNEIINRAKAFSDNILILVGSSNKPRSPKNPFTFEERKRMISAAQWDNITILPLNDYRYNDQKWVTEVQNIIQTVCSARKLDPRKVAIIGCKKDKSSFYLDYFPQWDFIELEYNTVLHATDIRDLYFSGNHDLSFLKGVVPPETFVVLQDLRETPDIEEVYKEHLFIKNYQRQWSATPYPVNFVTVDAVVVDSGHVLLVERGAIPGKGLWALPGGFLDPDERVIDGAIRELREETGLKIPAPVLKGSIKAKEVFDDPNRSERGRTITHAVHIALSPTVGGGKLPAVKGGDDAAKAKWVPLSEIKESNMYEDHFAIIDYFLGL